MNDFERSWRSKLADGLVALGRPELFASSNPCTVDAPLDEQVAWSARLVGALGTELPAESLEQLLTGCACRYPSEPLAFLRDLYRKTGDLARTHQALQDFFLEMIRGYKRLDDEDLAFIVEQNMGMAGKLEGRTITAVKIPKDFQSYRAEEDPDRRARLYCHCPRIRDSLTAAPAVIPPDYCLCSAGFYRFLWEEILEKPVSVSVGKSLLAGDPVCEIRIDLPADA